MNSIESLTVSTRFPQQQEISPVKPEPSITRKFLTCIVRHKDTPFNPPHNDYLEPFMKSLQGVFSIMEEARVEPKFVENTGWRLRFEKPRSSVPAEREAVAQVMLNEFESLARIHLKMARRDLPDPSDFDGDEEGKSQVASKRLVSAAKFFCKHLETKPRMLLETDSEDIAELRKAAFDYCD